MNRICKCGENVNLQGENVGKKIIYESSCSKCKRWIVVEVDARTGSIIRDVYSD